MTVNPILTHLRAHTTKPEHGHVNNCWPDQLEIISITAMGPNPLSLYELGRRVGRNAKDGSNTIYLTQGIPTEVTAALTDAGHIEVTHATVAVILDDHCGNAGLAMSPNPPNVGIVFPPRAAWDQHAHQYVMAAPAIVVRVGCDHDIEERVLGNCYRGYTCRKCDYNYTVDSGD